MRDVVRVPLHGRHGAIRGYALVDSADFEGVDRHRWFLSAEGYAVRSLKPGHRDGRKVRMHREILGLVAGDPRQGDHRNGNRIDNRRCNLRIVSDAENKRNLRSKGGTSAHRGVSWDKDSHRWRAQATYKGKNYNLGRFSDEADAVAAVDQFWGPANLRTLQD